MWLLGCDTAEGCVNKGESQEDNCMQYTCDSRGSMNLTSAGKSFEYNTCIKCIYFLVASERIHSFQRKMLRLQVFRFYQKRPFFTWGNLFSLNLLWLLIVITPLYNFYSPSLFDNSHDFCNRTFTSCMLRRSLSTDFSEIVSVGSFFFYIQKKICNTREHAYNYDYQCSK